MIYFDNAATSYPKPREVINEINKAFTLYGANPGRSGHDMSMNTAMAVYSAREMLNSSYEDAVYDLDDMDNQYQEDVKRLEADAEAQRTAIREQIGCAETET